MGLTSWPASFSSARTIAEKVAKEGYRFSSLVLKIVQSDAFQTRAKVREGGR